jgi:phosphate transport system substrate-binding protein
MPSALILPLSSLSRMDRGIYPDTGNIRNGLYPLTSSFYVVYKNDNPNPNVRKLVDWLLSPEGQKLIEACGYSPINSP